MRSYRATILVLRDLDTWAMGDFRVLVLLHLLMGARLLLAMGAGMKPLAIDLYAGLGGWSEGLLAEGWDVVGFDIERHVYGEHRYPAQLVLQDILTLHGSQFKDAALIVASPPCQKFSYMAMPWSKAKAKEDKLKYGPEEDRKRLTALFDACFRIQREACEAAGRHIPLVVENVRGAQKWVGRARWNFGSFYLWGDVPALMPIARRQRPKFILDDMHAGQRRDVEGIYADGKAIKNNGGSWFNIGSPGQKELNRNPVHEATKGANGGWFNDNKRSGKGKTGYLSSSGSKSNARKAASAMIAKIPFVLAQYIAHVYKP